VQLHPTFVSPLEPAYAVPGGPWDVPTLDDLLSATGDRPDLIVDGGHTWSSHEVEAHLSRVAAGLRHRGAGRGDVVAWQLPNGLESVLLLRACWRLGAIAAPLHPRAGTSEVSSMEATLAPRVVVRSAADVHDLARTGAGMREIVVGESGVSPADLATVLFTAGSTGSPKGVLHSHRTLVYKAITMVRVHGLSSSDTVLMPAPLAHVSGLLNGVLVPGVAGMRTVLMARWSSQEALELVKTHQVSFMVGPPTFFVAMLDDPGFSPPAVRSLRLVSCGGAGVSERFVRDATERFGAVVKRSYGSTEAPTVATGSNDDPLDRLARFDGRAVGHAELMVVRATDLAPGGAGVDPGGEVGGSTGLTPAGVGVEGELLVRGPELFAGYLDRSDNDAALIRDGWFRTGDLARIDSDGWLTITGRCQDVIIRAGENIATAEVEAVLEAHPFVRQAAVVGRPDPVVGERAVAFVVAAADFDLAACRAWFDQRGVARFKTPEEVVRLDEMPLLPAGKVDRARLRATLGEGS
jgi:acyl-CoA synthetase (AMP-forming)/AMP-acid ligase II